MFSSVFCSWDEILQKEHSIEKCGGRLLCLHLGKSMANRSPAVPGIEVDTF